MHSTNTFRLQQTHPTPPVLHRQTLCLMYPSNCRTPQVDLPLLSLSHRFPFRPWSSPHRKSPALLEAASHFSYNTAVKPAGSTSIVSMSTPFSVPQHFLRQSCRRPLPLFKKQSKRKNKTKIFLHKIYQSFITETPFDYPPTKPANPLPDTSNSLGHSIAIILGKAIIKSHF